MASFVFNRGAKLLTALDASDVDWTADTIKAALISTSQTPDKDDTAMSTYTANRLGTDQTLAGTQTIVENTTSDRIEYQASAGVTWTAVTTGATAGYVVIYKFVSNDAGSTPLFLIDITDTPTNGGDIALTFASNVVAYLQQ